MSDRASTRPNATTYLLEDIVTDVYDGRVRVPDFQRRFRWQWEDVRRLFDSIVRGYPIGSILLWQRPALEDKIKLGALTISAPKLDQALWVVDGQQRLTSLANALSPHVSNDPRFAAAYDLKSQGFVKASVTRELVVPLPTIFDLQALLQWFSEHPEHSSYLEKATAVAKAIRQYTIPAYLVAQRDETILRDIFDRMNNYGKRLTRAEVFSALHTDGQAGRPEKTFSDIVERLDSECGFGFVDDDTVLKAVLARRGPDVTRDIRAEFSANAAPRDFSDENVGDAYSGGEDALLLAVRFLQQDAGVPHFGFLTYRYLLVVLTRFFALYPAPEERNRRLLRRWFWRASSLGPGKFGGWTPTMRFFTTQVIVGNEADAVQRLLSSLDGTGFRMPRVARFRTTAAYSRIMLCALWGLKPRSMTSGEAFDLSSVATALQGRTTASDVVQKVVKKEPKGMTTRAANRFLMLEDGSVEQVRGFFAQRPSQMDEDVWNLALASHCLSESAARSLLEGRLEDFLRIRQGLMVEAVHEFLVRMTEPEQADTPPLSSLYLDDDDDDDDDDEEPRSE